MLASDGDTSGKSPVSWELNRGKLPKFGSQYIKIESLSPETKETQEAPGGMGSNNPSSCTFSCDGPDQMFACGTLRQRSPNMRRPPGSECSSTLVTGYLKEYSDKPGCWFSCMKGLQS